jgi:hypothetical protein
LTLDFHYVLIRKASSWVSPHVPSSRGVDHALETVGETLGVIDVTGGLTTVKLVAGRVIECSVVVLGGHRHPEGHEQAAPHGQLQQGGYEGLMHRDVPVEVVGGRGVTVEGGSIVGGLTVIEGLVVVSGGQQPEAHEQVAPHGQLQHGG